MFYFPGMAIGFGTGLAFGYIPYIIGVSLEKSHI